MRSWWWGLDDEIGALIRKDTRELAEFAFSALLTQRGAVSTQRKGGSLQASNITFNRTPLCWHPRLPASRTVRKYIPVVKVTPSMVFCYDTLIRLIQVISN